MKNFTEAKTYCEEQGAKMAMPKSDAENTAAYNVCKTLSPGRCFLGLEFQGEDDWYWSDNTKVEWNAWDGSEGSNGNTGETIGCYFNNQKWHDIRSVSGGGARLRALCQKFPELVPFTLNYGEQTNVKYLFGKTPLPQANALKKCEEAGATLIQVDSQTEHDALFEFLKSDAELAYQLEGSSGLYLWTGCKTTAGVRDFKWMDGTF